MTKVHGKCCKSLLPQERTYTHPLKCLFSFLSANISIHLSVCILDCGQSEMGDFSGSWGIHARVNIHEQNIRIHNVFPATVFKYRFLIMLWLFFSYTFQNKNSYFCLCGSCEFCNFVFLSWNYPHQQLNPN